MNIFLNMWHTPGVRRGLEAHRQRLYRLAYSWCHDPSLADDLVQDTLYKALHKGGQVREEHNAEHWLCKVLANTWRDHLRRSRDMDDVDDVPLTDNETPETRHQRDQACNRVRTAVARLPMGQRQVLTLIDLEEMSYAAVADTLGIPVGTVMSRISRARAALKGLLLSDAGRGTGPLAKSGLRRVK